MLTLSRAKSLSKLHIPKGPVSNLFGNPRLEDFDGDGYLDVASINTRIRRNITTGSNINFTPNITFAGFGNLAYADFNQDAELINYDNFHKMYKVNWLLKEHS